MAEEGAAEKVYEAGLELVNPGGQPEVLEAAADAWRALGTHLDKFVVHMDKKVKAVYGTEWRGPAADAFMEHWREVKKSVEDSQDTFTNAAKGLDDAAENIKKVNAEIHQIYIEIGVTVAATAVTSFVTMGFSAAAGAANAARLAGEATAAATRLGRLLMTIARAFQLITAQGRLAVYGTKFLVEYGANVATSYASGKGGEFDKNVANAALGLVGGAAAGKMLGGMGEGMAKSVSEGALGGALGSLGGDTANNVLIPGEEFDASQMALGAAGGAVGGGVGGGLQHKALDGLLPSTAAPDGTSGTGDTTPSDGTSGTGNTTPSDGNSGMDGSSAGGSSGSEGAATGNRLENHYGDAADAGLGKPAGIFFGEETNDVKDWEAGEERPNPDATLHGDPNGKTAEDKAGVLAEDRQNAQAARQHTSNTSLKEDFG